MSPADGRPEDGADDEADDGPIELPEGASCARCAYSFTVQVPGPSVIAGQPGTPRQARFCRRGPPSAVVMPNPQGASIVGQPPPVSDDFVCFEFDLAPVGSLV